MTRRRATSVDPKDLADAVVFVNETFDKDVRPEQLRLQKIVQMKPEDFAFDASHLGDEPGWLREYPESSWLDELQSTYSRNFDHILNFYRKKQMPPGIQIDGLFGDGLGRAMFHYALGIKTMPVAIYTSRG
jgi:hypothetical protein